MKKTTFLIPTIVPLINLLIYIYSILNLKGSGESTELARAIYSIGGVISLLHIFFAEFIYISLNRKVKKEDSEDSIHDKCVKIALNINKTNTILTLIGALLMSILVFSSIVGIGYNILHYIRYRKNLL